MITLRSAWNSLLCLVLSTICFAGTASGEIRYLENFTSRLYRDPVNTTALWDTVGGELKLHPFQLEIIGAAATSGLALKVVISGNYAYVAANEAGLLVVDISDPANPVVVGTYDTPGTANDVAIWGAYACVADGGSLRLIDISDPEVPVPAGSYAVAGQGVTVSGTLAYVAAGDMGLYVINIENPSSPRFEWSYNTPGAAVGVALYNGHALVADFYDLQIVDPPQWTLQNSLTGHVLYNVCFIDANIGTVVGSSGTVRRTTDGGDTWTVQSTGESTYPFDVSFTDANTGTIVGNAGVIFRTTNGGVDWTPQTSGTVENLYAVCMTTASVGTAVGNSGTILRTTNGGTTWTPQTSGTTEHLFDVSFTSNTTGTAVGTNGVILRTVNGGTTWTPQTSGTTFTLRGVCFTSSTTGTTVGSGSVILRTVNGGTTWTPQTSGIVSSFMDVDFYDANIGIAVGISGTVIRTTDGGATWKKVDCGSGENLEAIAVINQNTASLVGWDGAISRYELPPAIVVSEGWTRDVAVSGNLLFLADYWEGIDAVDISDPYNPVHMGSYGIPYPEYCSDLSVSGSFVYSVDSRGLLQVIDFNIPASPVLFGSCTMPVDAFGVAVSGDIAAVADGSSGLQVVRIAAPTPPAAIGGYDTPGNAHDVVVSGNYAYVADYLGGFEVVDISDRANPVLAGFCGTPANAAELDVLGNYAYVMDNLAGLQIIDITDPFNPVPAGYYNSPGDAKDVAVAPGYAYLADGYSGLQVIDVSDPSNPILAGSYNTAGYAYGVTLIGHLAIVADGPNGLHIIDVSNPASPTLVGTCDTPGSARRVAIYGNYAVVADGDQGFEMMDISDPASPVIVGSHATYSAYDVTVSGKYAFVATYGYSIQAFDISYPIDPVFLWDSGAFGFGTGIDVSGDYVYVANYNTGLEIFRVFQRFVDPERDRGQSLALNPFGAPIIRARLETVQNDSIAWELCADAGAHWQTFTPGSGWAKTDFPGCILTWRSTHPYLDAASMVNPTCSELEIGWLHDCAVIDSIRDIPDDQGGETRIFFSRSGYDFADEAAYPIATYNVLRRVDDVGTIRAVAEKNAAMTQAVAAGETVTNNSIMANEAAAPRFGPPESDNFPILPVDGRLYVIADRELQAAGMPPGTWEVLGTFAAMQSEQYIHPVATTADSSFAGIPYSVYVVTAHTTTPSVWFASPPDSGWSVDNIAPGVPAGFAVAYNTGSGNELSWNPSSETDFQYFRIYRSESADFTPSPENLVHATAETLWLDGIENGYLYYYRITAVDHAGNESDPASPSTTTDAGTPFIPVKFALMQNVPNPFNPVTRIGFDLPRPSRVRLAIYNVKGELVATLIDGQMSEGRKEAIWNGTNDNGVKASSGVYFYRITAGDFTQTKKMILLR